MYDGNNLRKVIAYVEVDEKNCYYYTAERKGLVIAIEGIESEVNIDAVWNALVEQGFFSKSVFSIINHKNQNHPICICMISDTSGIVE